VIAWLTACSTWFAPSVTALELPGVRVELADGFVALETREVEARLAEARVQAPEQVHELVGAQRGPRGAGGVVQLQRSVDADPARHGATVEEVLARLEADLRRQTGDGAALGARDRDGGRELCATLEADGTVRRSCALLTVHGAPPRLVVRSITCRAPDASICERPMASRRYATTAALPPAARLVEPGALPRAGTRVWGFVLGSTRDAFRAACRRAGLAVDAYDWSEQPPVVREWYDAGRTARCEGLPVQPAIGEARAASAVFEEDRLIGLTVFLDATAASVAPALERRYPLAVQGADQVLHVIDPEASGDALQSVTRFGEGDEPVRLTFLSERGSR